MDEASRRVLARGCELALLVMFLFLTVAVRKGVSVVGLVLEGPTVNMSWVLRYTTGRNLFGNGFDQAGGCGCAYGGCGRWTYLFPNSSHMMVRALDLSRAHCDHRR